MGGDPFGDVGTGEVIGGYRLERLLGAGSTSSVFLAKHVRLGRRAAIKVLAQELLGNKDAVHRLLQEARVVNDIGHPNIIDIIDFVESESPPRVALVMEYIEGPSLKALREHHFTYEQALGIALQLVAAIQAAHAAGVIHRDIKPDNLLLTKDPRNEAPSKVPRLKIVDFGIAKLAGSGGGKTATGMMLGTPAYMAPEQVAGRPPPSTATDVFAIGEVLFELLAHKRAYPAAAIHETVRAKLRGEIPELQLPPVPGERQLHQLIVRCLSLKPQDRPQLQDVRELLLSLAPWPELATARKAESVAHVLDPTTRPWMESIDVAPSELAPRVEDLRTEGLEVMSSREIEPSTPGLDLETREFRPGEILAADDGMVTHATDLVPVPSAPHRVPPPGAATELMVRIPAMESSPTNPIVKPVAEPPAAQPRIEGESRSRARAAAIPAMETALSESPLVGDHEDTGSGEDKHTVDTPLGTAGFTADSGEQPAQPSFTNEETSPRRVSLPAVTEPWTDEEVVDEPRSAAALRVPASVAVEAFADDETSPPIHSEPVRERRGSRPKSRMSSTTIAVIVFLWLLAVGLVAMSWMLREEPATGAHEHAAP